MPTFAKASPKPNISSAKSPAVGSHNACHTSKPTVITILCQPRLATAARREWRQTETGAFEAREVFNMEETHCEVVGKQGRKSEGRAPSSVASRSSNAVPRSGPTVLFWNLSLGGIYQEQLHERLRQEEQARTELAWCFKARPPPRCSAPFTPKCDQKQG